MLASTRGSAATERAGRAPAVLRSTGLLVALAGALVCYRALCKVLLFRNLEYTGSDLYGILDQSWSWLYTGRLLQDNAYGNQGRDPRLLPAPGSLAADDLAGCSGRGYAVSAFTTGEVRLWSCVAARLPAGTPVSPVAEILPFFHRQSIVFQGLEDRASRPARLRVYRAQAGTPSPAAGRSCPGPRVRDLVADVDCDLQVLLAPCGWPARPDAARARGGADSVIQSSQRVE